MSANYSKQNANKMQQTSSHNDLTRRPLKRIIVTRRGNPCPKKEREKDNGNSHGTEELYVRSRTPVLHVRDS